MTAVPCNTWLRCSGLVLFVVLCSVRPAPAQDETADARAPVDLFEERIGIEIVNIDVVVVDKKGRAVEGLTRDDFELRIDGREVEIANFHAAVAGDDGAAPPPPVEAGDDWAPVAPAAVTPATPRDPLHLVVYFDSFYLTPISRKRALEELPAFFERQIAAGARILLASHVQDLQVMSSFTTDLEVLEGALARVAEAPAVGLQQVTGHRLTLNNIRDVYQTCEASPFLEPCLDCLEQMIELARFYGLGVLNERRGAVAALGDIVNALSVLDGRKAVLHLSDGIEQQPAIDLFYYIGEQLCPEKRQQLQEHYLRQNVDDLSDIVARANASRVTFYALEAAGARNYSSASAEFGDSFFKPSPTNDMIRIANLQGTLHYISSETGGKPILNANQFAADLDRLTDEMRTYYSLGYQPGHPGRGRAHRVSVKVAKKGHELRYRRSFLHKKPEHQLADRALGAVFFGVAENPLGAAVEAKPQSPGKGGRVVVPLEVSVPLSRFTLLPRQDARHGQMTVVVAAPDENNDDIAIRRKEFPLSLPHTAEAGEDVYRFGVNIELFPGSYRLGVGVWDDIAAVGSFLNVPVEVAAPASGGEEVSE